MHPGPDTARAAQTLNTGGAVVTPLPAGAVPALAQTNGFTVKGGPILDDWARAAFCSSGQSTSVTRPAATAIARTGSIPVPHSRIGAHPAAGSRRRQRSTLRHARLAGAPRCAGPSTAFPQVGSRPLARSSAPPGRRRACPETPRCRGRPSLGRSGPEGAPGVRPMPMPMPMPMRPRLRPVRTALRSPGRASPGRGSWAGSSRCPWLSGRSGRT